jgi:hypothetical protein
MLTAGWRPSAGAVLVGFGGRANAAVRHVARRPGHMVPIIVNDVLPGQRLDVDHRKPAQPCANLTPYFGVRAVATDQIASGNVMIQAVLEVLGATSGGDPQRLRGSSRS